MYTHTCPACGGTGSTMFRQNGGKCYTCGGSGKVTPADVDREMSRQRRTVRLHTGRLVGDLLLAEAGDGTLAWVGAPEALGAGCDVLVPSHHADRWEVAKVVEVNGVTAEMVGPAPF